MSIRTAAICVAASLTMALVGASRYAGADTTKSSPFSFFESLFGIAPQSAPPRARHRPRAYRPPPRPARRLQPHTVAAPPPAIAGGGLMPTYRTMCVRLCDGYYWPISFATDEAHFSRDSRRCTRSCGAPAALYYYPNPGGAPEDMVSLKGVPYKSLATAFLFRTAYDESCKCRPHPWETEAHERSQQRPKESAGPKTGPHTATRQPAR
jgi:hypothetical protein